MSGTDMGADGSALNESLAVDCKPERAWLTAPPRALAADPVDSACVWLGDVGEMCMPCMYV